jgi:hypothetical protein
MVKIQKKSGVEREVQREGERGSRSRGKREWHWGPLQFNAQLHLG